MNMKRVIYITAAIIALLSINCSAGNPVDKNAKSAGNDKVSQLTEKAFKELIYNYDVNKSWKYEGSKPVIIDFYADWCPPCRQLSPLVEEIASEYEGKIVVYKVNSDNERGLVQKLGIESLPTLLYIPAEGKPQVTLGYIPKEYIVKTINEILLKN
jgi:thioredoxin 1